MSAVHPGLQPPPPPPPRSSLSVPASLPLLPTSPNLSSCRKRSVSPSCAISFGLGSSSAPGATPLLPQTPRGACPGGPMSPLIGSAVTGAGCICCTSEGLRGGGGAGRKASSVSLGSSGSLGLWDRRVFSRVLAVLQLALSGLCLAAASRPRAAPLARPLAPFCGHLVSFRRPAALPSPPGVSRLRPVRAHAPPPPPRLCACVLTCAFLPVLACAPRPRPLRRSWPSRRLPAEPAGAAPCSPVRSPCARAFAPETHCLPTEPAHRYAPASVHTLTCLCLNPLCAPALH